MDGRKDRILIPSAVALIAFGATLLLASDIIRCPCHHWLYCVSGNTFDFLKILASTGIITVGIGYLCHAIFTGWTLWCRETRLVDFQKLISAFGLSNVKLQQLNKNEQILEDELLAEFHLRLHSHAPSTLIDFCSRRNTGWYVAITSSLASMIGYFAALLTICYLDPKPSSHIPELFVLGAIFFIFIPCVLYSQGKKWNQEFWEVCWKWISWDIQSHPLPPEWAQSIYKKIQRAD